MIDLTSLMAAPPAGGPANGAAPVAGFAAALAAASVGADDPTTAHEGVAPDELSETATTDAVALGNAVASVAVAPATAPPAAPPAVASSGSRAEVDGPVEDSEAAPLGQTPTGATARPAAAASDVAAAATGHASMPSAADSARRGARPHEAAGVASPVVGLTRATSQAPAHARVHDLLVRRSPESGEPTSPEPTTGDPAGDVLADANAMSIATDAASASTSATTTWKPLDPSSSGAATARPHGTSEPTADGADQPVAPSPVGGPSDVPTETDAVEIAAPTSAADSTAPSAPSGAATPGADPAVAPTVPVGPSTPAGETSAPAPSGAVARLVEAVERLEAGPPPRSVVLDLRDAAGDGGQVRLRVLGSEVHVALRGDLSAVARAELESALEARGLTLASFDDESATGDATGERGHGRPDPRADGEEARDRRRDPEGQRPWDRATAPGNAPASAPDVPAHAAARGLRL